MRNYRANSDRIDRTGMDAGQNLVADRVEDFSDGFSVPIGGCIVWPSDQAVPTNYVPCDGRFLSLAQFPGAWRVVGFKYGGAPESGKFAAPSFSDVTTGGHWIMRVA